MTQPWMKFSMSDWCGDRALHSCSLAARGLWMEMLAIMSEATPRGSLLINGRQVDMRSLANCAAADRKETERLFRELDESGVFSRDEDGTIFSRRMRRDEEKAELNRTRGADGGNPDIRRGTVPKDKRVRPFRRSDAPEKTRRIFDRERGSCHWCGAALMFRWSGQGDMPANVFHVDHVIAVCDGGTNDEANLVAACAACNHKRARDTKPRLVSEHDPTAMPTLMSDYIPTLKQRS
jgi:hypothetical protein